MKSGFGLSLLVALCLLLAVGEWFESYSLTWDYLFNLPPTAGAFGAAAHDIRKQTPAEALERGRREREILTALRWSTRVSRASATLAVLGAIALVWRARRAPGLRWLPAALLSLVAAAVFVLVVVT